DRNQHPGWFATFILERMRRPDRHIYEHPGAGNESLFANREGDLAFQNVESLFLPAVDVRRRTAARRHDGFPKSVLAVGVVASCQETVHVTDDGDGAAFGGLSDDGLFHFRLLHLLWLALF